MRRNIPEAVDRNYNLEMPRGPQLNVRLSDAAADAFDAAVFVRSLRSAQELAGPALEELAEQLMTDPAVADAVALRRKTRRSNVTPMRLPKDESRR
jgi:hypothetical protein